MPVVVAATNPRHGRRHRRHHRRHHHHYCRRDLQFFLNYISKGFDDGFVDVCVR